jgi:hypothetical protein
MLTTSTLLYNFGGSNMKIEIRFWGIYDTCPWGVDNKDNAVTLNIYGKGNRCLICSDGKPVTKTIYHWLRMAQKLSLTRRPYHAKSNHLAHE